MKKILLILICLFTSAINAELINPKIIEYASELSTRLEHSTASPELLEAAKGSFEIIQLLHNVIFAANRLSSKSVAIKDNLDSIYELIYAQLITDFVITQLPPKQSNEILETFDRLFEHPKMRYTFAWLFLELKKIQIHHSTNGKISIDFIRRSPLGRLHKHCREEIVEAIQEYDLDYNSVKSFDDFLNYNKSHNATLVSKRRSIFTLDNVFKISIPLFLLSTLIILRSFKQDIISSGVSMLSDEIKRLGNQGEERLKVIFNDEFRDELLRKVGEVTEMGKTSIERLRTETIDPVLREFSGNVTNQVSGLRGDLNGHVGELKGSISSRIHNATKHLQRETTGIRESVQSVIGEPMEIQGDEDEENIPVTLGTLVNTVDEMTLQQKEASRHFWEGLINLIEAIRNQEVMVPIDLSLNADRSEQTMANKIVGFLFGRNKNGNGDDKSKPRQQRRARRELDIEKTRQRSDSQASRQERKQSDSRGSEEFLDANDLERKNDE